MHVSWFFLIVVGGVIVVVSVLVITLVIALASGRVRNIVSVLLAVGLSLLIFLSAATMFVAIVRTSSRHVELVHPLVTHQYPLAPGVDYGDQYATMPDAFNVVNLDETPTPLEPAAIVERPKAEPPEAAKDASPAPDETSGTEDPKSAQPPPDDNRPDWVGTEPEKVDGVYRVPVTVGPWPTSEEAMKRLPAAVDKEIAKYAVNRTGHKAAAKLGLPRNYIMGHMIKKDVWEESLKINSFDDVKHMVGRDVWENSADAADGEWTQLHVLVKFDDEVNRRLDDGWDRLLRVERLQVAGVLGAIVLIMLGAVYCYLKIDLKTGGAYRGRLRAGALAAILALVVLVLWSQA
jgi:hypothetical protein